MFKDISCKRRMMWIRMLHHKFLQLILASSAKRRSPGTNQLKKNRNGRMTRHCTVVKFDWKRCRYLMPAFKKMSPENHLCIILLSNYGNISQFIKQLATLWFKLGVVTVLQSFKAVSLLHAQLLLASNRYVNLRRSCCRDEQ